MNATVADRGQVTIPKEIRRRLGVGPRTVLDFQADQLLTRDRGFYREYFRELTVPEPTTKP